MKHMETTTTRYKALGNPETVSLPTIRRPAHLPTIDETKSPLFKRLSQEDLLSPDSNEIVHTWLFVQPDSNKRVQFARDDTHQNDKTTQSPRPVPQLIEPLHDIDHHTPGLDLTSFEPMPTANKNEDRPSKPHDNHLASIVQPKFYRSTSYRAVSISSAASSSLTRLRHSTRVPSPSLISHHRAPSDEPSASYISTSTGKDRPFYLSLLELNPSLSESDQKKFDDIRQQLPEEFEQLLPTLFKLGVVLWPKKFFDHNETLTVKERRQRQRLVSIMESNEENSQRQHHLRRLYGSVLPNDDISHKHHLLRENLSFEGQLSLLGAYRDAIESELTKKVQRWRSIPMRGLQTSYIDDTNSVNRSSILSNTFQIKHKFLETLSSRKSKSYSNNYQSTSDEHFSLTIPDQIDQQWQRKSLVKIIEQGMNILDQVRKLSQPDILIHDEDFDLNGHHIVRTFRRWLFLWSTLFTEDKCLL